MVEASQVQEELSEIIKTIAEGTLGNVYQAMFESI